MVYDDEYGLPGKGAYAGMAIRFGASHKTTRVLFAGGDRTYSRLMEMSLRDLWAKMYPTQGKSVSPWREDVDQMQTAQWWQERADMILDQWLGEWGEEWVEVFCTEGVL